MIKDVDQVKWITTSKIAVPLKTCTAMAAEIADASVLTSLLDLFFDKKLNVENINRCTDEVMMNTEMHRVLADQRKVNV